MIVGKVDETPDGKGWWTLFILIGSWGEPG
jgi:hypothetical protein